MEQNDPTNPAQGNASDRAQGALGAVTTLPVSPWQVRLARVLSTGVGIALVVGIVVGAAVGAVGAALSLRQTPVYSSSTVMLIDDPLALATAGNADQVIKLEQLRTKYAALAGTYAIAAPVARQLGLPVSEVIDDVTVGQPPNSLLMDVTASSTNPGRAQLLSKTVAAAITTYVGVENAQYHVPAGFQFSIKTIDPPTIPVAPTKSKTHAAAVGVGFAVLGFVVAFLALQLLRNRKLLH